MRLLYISSGAALGIVLGFLFSSLLSQVFEYCCASTGILTTEEATVYFLMWGLFVIGGGFMGSILFRRNLTLRSREGADKPRAP